MSIERIIVAPEKLPAFASLLVVAVVRGAAADHVSYVPLESFQPNDHPSAPFPKSHLPQVLTEIQAARNAGGNSRRQICAMASGDERAAPPKKTYAS